MQFRCGYLIGVLSLDLRGAVIVPVLTRDALAEIHQARIMLEGRAAFVAAIHRKAKDVDDVDALRSHPVTSP